MNPLFELHYASLPSEFLDGRPHSSAVASSTITLCRMEAAIADYDEPALLMQSKPHDSQLAFMMPVDDPGSSDYKANDAEAIRMREERQAAQMAQVSHSLITSIPLL